MNIEQLKEACKRNNITYIPHHKCSICGVTVGFVIYNGNVFFNSTCDCSCYPSPLQLSGWDEVLDWITNSNGEIEEEYKYLIK